MVTNGAKLSYPVAYMPISIPKNVSSISVSGLIYRYHQNYRLQMSLRIVKCSKPVNMRIEYKNLAILVVSTINQRRCSLVRSLLREGNDMWVLLTFLHKFTGKVSVIWFVCPPLYYFTTRDWKPEKGGRAAGESYFVELDRRRVKSHVYLSMACGSRAPPGK